MATPPLAGAGVGQHVEKGGAVGLAEKDVPSRIAASGDVIEGAGELEAQGVCHEDGVSGRNVAMQDLTPIRTPFRTPFPEMIP